METLKSNSDKRAAAASARALAHARDSAGRFAVEGEKPKADTARRREDKKRHLKERDYLRSIVAEIGRDDVAAIARTIVEDAKGGDADVKVINAAREWIGKYLLGNARVALDDCERLPAIVKRK